jgi:hypothetical protein
MNLPPPEDMFNLIRAIALAFDKKENGVHLASHDKEMRALHQEALAMVNDHTDGGKE